MDGVEDIDEEQDVDVVWDADTAGDVVGAEGVVLDLDLPEETSGVEVMGGEGDLGGAKDTVEVHDDDNVQNLSEA